MASYPMAATSIYIIMFLLLKTTSSFRIEINPMKVTEETNGDVKITCSLDATDECSYRDNMLLELRKDSGQPLAFVRPRSGIKFGHNNSKKYQGQGSMGQHNNRSFLNVTVLAPSNDDSGEYTCIVRFLIEDGVLRENQVSKNLSVEIFDVHQSLKTMMATVSLLEKEANARESKLQEEVSRLRERNSNQSRVITAMTDKVLTLESAMNDLKQLMPHKAERDSVAAIVDSVDELENVTRHQITQLEEKVTSSTAFSVTIKSNVDVPVGKVIVYNHVITNMGGAYDVATGIFTAPRVGLYAFHLAVHTRCSGCDSRAQIQVNGVEVTTVRAWNTGSTVQSSSSCVRALVPGDQVKVVSFSTGVQLEAWHMLNLFSGYLVRPF